MSVILNIDNRTITIPPNFDPTVKESGSISISIDSMYVISAVLDVIKKKTFNTVDINIMFLKVYKDSSIEFTDSFMMNKNYNEKNSYKPFLNYYIFDWDEHIKASYIYFSSDFNAFNLTVIGKSDTLHRLTTFDIYQKRICKLDDTFISFKPVCYNINIKDIENKLNSDPCICTSQSCNTQPYYIVIGICVFVIFVLIGLLIYNRK